MQVIDVRAQLPRAPEHDAGEEPKTSTTVHWTGMVMPAQLDDAAALEFVKDFAQGHIDRDWNDAIAGVQRGSGLMYHEVIYPSGTVAITRDPLAVLWHAGDAVGNRFSYAVLLLTGPRWKDDREGAPTAEQLRSLAIRLHERGGLVRGNREWSSTLCPGDLVQRWVVRFRNGEIPIGEEEDLTPEQDTRLKNIDAKLDALINQQTAFASNVPRIWLQRLFYGLNPFTGRPRGVHETPPAEIVVTD